MTRSTIQTLCQVNKAYHSENLVYYSGIFAANKVYFTWFVTLILTLDASTFRCVKGACSVIPFKGACTLKWGAHLNGVVGYIYCNQQYQRIYHTPRLNNIFLLILLDLLPLPLSLYVLLIMLLSISNYGSFFFLWTRVTNLDKTVYFILIILSQQLSKIVHVSHISPLEYKPP